MSQERLPAAPKRSSDKPASLRDGIPGDLCKTPIQMLFEYGTKIGKPPVYTLEKSEGQAHNPSFTFRVTIGEISCTGEGPSKKIAKHKAAESALNILKGDVNKLLPVPEVAKNQPKQVKGNPVGTLQSFLDTMAWQLKHCTLLSKVPFASCLEFLGSSFAFPW